MTTLRWSHTAQADLDAIFDYIAEDQPLNAVRFVDRLIDATGALVDQPRRGRRVPEARDAQHEVRELIVQGYRILYLVRGAQLLVLTVIHGSQLLATRQAKPWEDL